eukprot:4350435-Amphidinium_carterae.1
MREHWRREVRRGKVAPHVRDYNKWTYPVGTSSASSVSVPAGETGVDTMVPECKACRFGASKHDPRHTRDERCRHRNAEALGTECPGCRSGAPRHHESHIREPAGVCRWHLVPERRDGVRSGAVR